MQMDCWLFQYGLTCETRFSLRERLGTLLWIDSMIRIFLMAVPYLSRGLVVQSAKRTTPDHDDSD
jgi:hypothetical protein